jgi:hypothetical protein
MKPGTLFFCGVGTKHSGCGNRNPSAAEACRVSVNRTSLSANLYAPGTLRQESDHYARLSIGDGEVLDSRSLTAYRQAGLNHLHVSEDKIRRVSE